MGIEHPNFYENHKEALMRLRSTVVLYDGEPYQIYAIANHKPDGIFRVYMRPIGLPTDIQQNDQPFFQITANYNCEYPGVGDMFDKVVDTGKTNIIRKMMNSPKFNKFRPYPLGMCNIKGQGTFYIERQPNRKSEQGLIRSMLFETHVTTSGNRSNDLIRREGKIDLNSPAFRSCVLADHPTAQECLSQLLDPKVKNEAAAFDRYFAFARGPIDMIFLAYKGDIVGVLPKNDFSVIRLGRDFIQVKEAIEDLKLFNNITM